MGNGIMSGATAAVLADDEDEVEALVRSVLGRDDDDGITALDSFSPERLDGVDFGANGFPILLAKRAKSGGTRRLPPVAGRIVKADAEKRFTLVVGYPAGRADVQVAQDGHRDFAPADAVEAGAWDFMKRGAQVGMFHQDGTSGAGTVVESSIHRAPPWTMTAADGSQQTVHPGDWVVGIQWSEPAWQLVKTGRIGGVSMQGTAIRRKPTADELSGLRKGAGARKGSSMKALRKAARAAVDEATAPLMAQLEETGRRITAVEKSRRPVCAKCQKRVKAPDPRFCTNCGAKMGGEAIKSAPVPAGAGQAERLTAAEEMHLAALLRKARSADPDERLQAIAKLVEEAGAEVTAKIMGGGMVTPGEFTRAYLSAGRARQSGLGGRAPRIPEPTHVPVAADFRRGPLGAGQSRPAPASQWGGMGSQAEAYGPGLAIGPYNPYNVHGTGSSTITPALAGSQEAR